ncbi:19680_t:CDS:2 [Racocetra fulgida]|uniref:19680_t:CDS:1 n=1 Tax=Racocetra fulgida TaxID=60492 RepID=A0A9N9F2Z5_9GLOM|nr:19680_t:CDS:2 [Racocetra fulgida]
MVKAQYLDKANIDTKPTFERSTDNKEPFFTFVREHDSRLVQDICDGLRPSFAKEIPQLYVNLASQCMNATPSERPSANRIQKLLDDWIKEELYINMFREADEVESKSLEYAH